MQVTIDKNSGFCFGVVYAIKMAEDELASGILYCLGDIVHNDSEIKRLNKKGLKIIDHKQLKKLHDCKVLIRAHGEPPETYQIALENNIELIDASCPVVLKLQNRVKNVYDDSKDKEGQIVIYGKPGHAEVNALIGQTNKKAIIITDNNDLDKIDYTKPITLFSQTTKSTKVFNEIKSLIEQKAKEAGMDKFIGHDTICSQVSNRDEQLRKFAKKHDIIIFVGGKKSSNGIVLYEICKAVNSQSYYVSDETELHEEWLNNVDTVGVCGATSTPMWLMENVADYVSSNYNK